MKQLHSIRLLRYSIILVACLWAVIGYTQPPPPPPPHGADSIAMRPPRCHGDSAQVAIYTRAGGAFLYYRWSSGDTTQFVLLHAGMYYVTVTDSQLAVSNDSLLIIDPMPVTIITDTLRQPSAPAGADGIIYVHADGGIPGYSYQWSLPSNSGDSLVNLNPGVYTVIANDHNDCTASQTFSLFPTGIETIKESNTISLYPNPASHSLTISATDVTLLSFSIYNSLGALVLNRENLLTAKETVNISGLSPGAYLLVTKTLNGISQNKLTIAR